MPQARQMHHRWRIGQADVDPGFAADHGPAAGPSGHTLGQSNVQLLLLGHVQAQDRVEAVEHPAQVTLIGVVRPASLQLVDLAAEQADQVEDLAVGPAQRSRRFVIARRRGNRRIDRLVPRIARGREGVRRGRH